MYKYSKACNKYGSSMGRKNIIDEAIHVEKITIEHVKLTQGYDKEGAYWGNGEPLFVAYGKSKEYQQEYFYRSIENPIIEAIRIFKNIKSIKLIKG